MGQVVVEREQTHERKEHADGAQEVPHVVEVVELEQLALLVELARLRRRQLKHKTNNRVETKFARFHAADLRPRKSTCGRRSTSLHTRRRDTVLSR